MSFNEVIDNINTRIENIISTRLPNTYQHIRIEPSNYNPSIDDTITVTITVTNQSETPVTDFTVPLTINGESITGLTTDNNGEVEYTYTCSDFGIVKFEVNSYTSFIKVEGYKTVSDLTGISIYHNDHEVNLVINHTQNLLSTSDSEWRDLAVSSIPSALKPRMHQFSLTVDKRVRVRVKNDGTIQYQSDTYFGTGKSVQCNLCWLI